MNLKMMLGSALAVVAVVTGTTTAASAALQNDHSSSKPHDGLVDLRDATNKFHSIAVAEKSGYGLLTDKDGIACIDMPGMGGMGVHWANTTLVGDPAINPNQPEAMVYAPQRDGTLKLAAVEYVVVKAAWDAANPKPPSLFGHTFNTTLEPNRFGLPTFYSLHVWVWKHNAAGTFEMWNPMVVCRN
jgi:hypothetical protein